MNDTRIEPGAQIAESLRVPIQTIEKPKIVGFYSVNVIDGTVQFDSSCCKYLRKQLINQAGLKLDFSMHYQGYSEMHMNVPTERKIDRSYTPMGDMLNFILHNISSFSILSETNRTKLLSADVIAATGILVKLMIAHCDPHMKWSFIASKFKENVYICGEKVSHGNKVRQHFRHYLFSDGPGKDLNTSTPGANAFVTVLNTKLHETTLMYTIPVAGIDSEIEIEKQQNWDNLKLVKAKIMFGRKSAEYKFARFQSPAWWSTLMLLGNGEIQAGVSDEKHIFDRIETHTIESLLNNYERRWPKSRNQMLSFLNNILELVKLRLRLESSPHTVYKFEFDPNVSCTVRFTKYSGRNEYTFLTDEYIDAVNKL